jgi:hypothetical protein
MTLLQMFLYTYSLIRGITLRVIRFNRHTISQAVLPLLEKLMELVYQNNLQRFHPIFSNIPDVLKSLSIEGGLSNSGNSRKSLEAKSAKVECSSPTIHYWSIICHKLLDRGCSMMLDDPEHSHEAGNQLLGQSSSLFQCTASLNLLNISVTSVSG